MATADLLLGLTTLATVSGGSTSQGEQDRIFRGEEGKIKFANVYIGSIQINSIFSVLAHQHAPVCQEFLKLGAPRSLRGRLWSQILGSNAKSSVN